MNILTFFPIGYTKGFNVQETAIIQPQAKFSGASSNISYLCKQLANALKTSLLIYQNGTMKQLKQQELTKIAQNPSTEVKSPQNQIQQVSSQKPQQFQHSKREAKETSSKKLLKPEEKREKSHQKQNQNSSKHKIVLVKEKKELINKKLQKHHDIKKNSSKYKKRHHQRIRTSNVSLIDDAFCFSLSFPSNLLLEKRESLLQRQVWIWNQKLKKQVNKREIRMLNC